MKELVKANRSITAVYGFVLMLYIASLFISTNFISWKHLMLILVLASFLIVVSFGQGLVILVRGLDLSVSSMITVGGVLVSAWVSPSNENILWAIPLILLITSTIGFFNGIGIAILRIPPFVMTLSTGIIVYSAILALTKAAPNKGNAPSLLGNIMLEASFGIPNAVFLLIIFVFIAILLQNYSAIGRKLYLLGANPRAAHIYGLNDRLLTILPYMISGFCCGLAGMMLVGYADAPTLTMGEPYLISSIAAVVIGGSSILGGKGSYIGTVGGALLLTILSSLMTALGFSKGWRTIIEGTIIISALIMFASSEWNRRKTKTLQ